MSRKQQPCPTGKRRFGSALEAQVELWKIAALHSMGTHERRRETRAYVCEQCDDLHLTSTPERLGQAADTCRIS